MCEPTPPDHKHRARTRPRGSHLPRCDTVTRCGTDQMWHRNPGRCGSPHPPGLDPQYRHQHHGSDSQRRGPARELQYDQTRHRPDGASYHQVQSPPGRLTHIRDRDYERYGRDRSRSPGDALRSPYSKVQRYEGPSQMGPYVASSMPHTVLSQPQNPYPTDTDSNRHLRSTGRHSRQCTRSTNTRVATGRR